ncbi:MAG: hypothetical protein WCA20_11795 [Candidatus Sulfotelmatobacter sp.]
MPISHKLLLSPLTVENLTVLVVVDQHAGNGKSVVAAGSSVFSPAWAIASDAPVFTASPPFVDTSHQSMLEPWYALADVYPMIKHSVLTNCA